MLRNTSTIRNLKKVERINVGGRNCGALRQERKEMKDEAEKAKEEGKAEKMAKEIFTVKHHTNQARRIETESGAENKRARAGWSLGRMENVCF